jgi:diacylglycerol O-acyltransferase / wax synthase
MPVALPADGDLRQRLGRTAQITRARKASVPGASAALLGAGFRLLAAVHLLRWFMNHQRLIHTFVTNLRGPDQPLTFNGATVTDVIPITLTTGNVTVAFAALSYAGTLTITVIADSGRVRDLPVLAGALRAELALASANAPA